MMKKLIELEPCFLGSGGEGVTDMEGNPVPRREGIGLCCNCPCGCGEVLFVHFKNPLDGGPCKSGNAPAWDRTGDAFETLTLRPSLLRMGGCGWHGYLTDGIFEEC